MYTHTYIFLYLSVWGWQIHRHLAWPLPSRSTLVPPPAAPLPFFMPAPPCNYPQPPDLTSGSPVRRLTRMR